MSFPGRLRDVQERIHQACALHGRESARIRLIAVSKTFPAADVREAYAAGLRDFGENYVQEGVEKIASLSDLRTSEQRIAGNEVPDALQDDAADRIRWHFIGPLQSNKSREVAENFDWMHTVDREKIARRLSEQRPASLHPLQVCLQVNLGGESSKSGVAPAEVAALARAVSELPRLTLRGLMTIPEPTSDEALQRQRFRELGQLLLAVRAGLPAGAASAMDTLSMGMSADLESAIAESPPGVTTMIRVGTALFGNRPRPDAGA
jgi:pyridoxal phosphate enzyme (YggS family)